MGVKIGNLDISAFKVGSADCAIYLGDVKLYPSEQPSFQGKWLATYTAGTTSSAECDSTSAITQNEITLTDLQAVIIGDCVTSIGNNAFSGSTSLSSCTIGSGVTSIGRNAFSNCKSLTSIDIPSGVTTISNSAFAGCNNLTSINIQSGVTSISDWAFAYCTSLTSIDIPSGVTSIGSAAFLWCTSLTSITVNAVTPPTLGSDTFDNTNDCPIYVPAASVSAYQSATNWSAYASRIRAIPSPYQWVTFTNGDTISSDLQIYGIKGIVNDLNSAFDDNSQPIFVEDAGRNKYNIIIGGINDPCYTEYDIISDTSVEYTFSNVGCSDSYTVSSKTITYLSNDIQLLIYA